ncbi:GIY-YIG nuclease family protein [Candidatus Nitrosacidococcus tergens]|uniref:Bacteriophage T5 Orf172 DNA-binding domain-containing protein n=1 Tax=Candidatus Nitrosacidococcus tergens TaxID=553981 RepID=A0A7G1QAM7_9GAMM|nr:GIY-YIG nuclease family protein [Candidatus Nitrosacidococcus tergens]CAB1276132.1 conserved protein of unknown function [Candidatus Nitrosacidococcus tergens]
MAKGIIYLMTTAVPGLVKIGQTGTDNYQERMRTLEANGYYNVVGLKRFFAIELEDYEAKEKLLHEIFSKHRLSISELFALDKDLVRQLLLSFDGKVIYPEKINKEKEFEEIAITRNSEETATTRKQGALFSFYKKGLKDGEQIRFAADNAIIATVAGEREVEYGGQTWKLSPLTHKVYKDKGQLNISDSYRGASYWQYNGNKLKDLPDI